MCILTSSRFQFYGSTISRGMSFSQLVLHNKYIYWSAAWLKGTAGAQRGVGGSLSSVVGTTSGNNPHRGRERLCVALLSLWLRCVTSAVSLRQAFNSETDNFKLLYGGHQYHASCANFWTNCVEPKPPGLILPDLLWALGSLLPWQQGTGWSTSER